MFTVLKGFESQRDDMQKDDGRYLDGKMITDKMQSWVLQLLLQMTSAVASVKNICPFALAVIQYLEHDL